MKIMVTGSGGREHALAWKSAQAAGVEKVFVLPGNAGTDQEPKLENVAIDVMDFNAQIAFAQANDIDLTIIGPEAPLVGAVVDKFTAAGRRCFGPSAGAARLEGSKTFAKDFLAKYQIPTAAYGSFTRVNEALAYASNMDTPMVIKADGLAAGKGVVIAQTHADAAQTINNMLLGRVFGKAGARVVVEEFLTGEEASFIVIADGKHAVPFASSQDHKAAFDGDQGPNTGGMGAYSPAPVITPEVHTRVMQEIIRPTLAGMIAEGHAYTGFLYVGLMIDARGRAKVIEFNCRFGDPETQPIMMRLTSDLVHLCNRAIDGRLENTVIEFDKKTALTVVMAAEGYPATYTKGAEISNIPYANDTQKTFHGGTSILNGRMIASGGRVLGVTTLGETLTEAQSRAYNVVSQIQFARAHYRRDIGYRAIARNVRSK